MKICVVSDSHDHSTALANCLAAAQADGCVLAIHCGDVIGANTLRASMQLGLPLHVIHGNNLGDPTAMTRLAAESGGLLTYHGQDATLQFGGRRIFVVHYPDYAQAMALTGNYDLVCCGHSHEAMIAAVTNNHGLATWLVNPGTTTTAVGAPHSTWIAADLATMRFEIRTVAED